MRVRMKAKKFDGLLSLFSLLHNPLTLFVCSAEAVQNFWEGCAVAVLRLCRSSGGGCAWAEFPWGGCAWAESSGRMCSGSAGLCRSS